MPDESGFSERLSPLPDVPTLRRARCRMVALPWRAPVLLVLAVLALAACQSTPTPAPTPVPTPTPILMPTPVLTPTPTPEVTMPVPTTTATDRPMLVALYHATGGLNWDNNRNWLSHRPLGEWHGVTTDGDGRVTRLYLYDNGLSGATPAELGSLPNLQSLDLSGNQLSGAIPAELGSLFNLQGLWLGGNQLSGQIPAELGSLPNLQGLWLGGNSTLSGPLPVSFTGLTSLTTLQMDGTELCAPTDSDIQAWMQSVVGKSGVVNCGRPDPVPTPAGPDRAALVVLYHATDGPNWDSSRNWLSDRPLGEWHGVTTDGDGRVTGCTSIATD